MSRTQILLSMFDPAGRGLEIGPSYNPLLPKSRYPSVSIVDHVGAEELRIKYATHPDAIEDVDFVKDGRSLLDAVPLRNHYDFIVASHVVEHTPDLVSFLVECEHLLNDAGLLVLAVPDKRHCFDVFMGLSTTGDILQAFHEKRTRHPAGKQFDHAAYAASRSDNIVWPIGCTDPIAFVHDTKDAMARFTAATGTADYMDAHSWKFTPSSFRLILNDLAETGFVALREFAFHDSIGPEFFVALSRSGAGARKSRLDLAKAIVEEHASITLPA